MSVGDGGLVELATRVGALAFVSERIFELEGSWAPRADAAAVAVHLATNSRHHGWHAGLWRDALPDSPALAAEALVRPPGPGWTTALDACAQVDPSDASRLAALYRGVVPRALALIADLEATLVGPGDAHVRRVAALVRRDVLDDWQRGHTLLTVVMEGAEHLDVALTSTKVLDQAFRTC